MILEDLQIAIDVAAMGSFAAVARARNIDPSHVSRAIATLEADLGARLFQRTTRRLTVTEAGARYLNRIGPLVAELSGAAQELSQEAEIVRGTVRLSAPNSVARTLILPLLPQFRETFPDLVLDCQFSDQVTDLVSEGIDLAIRMAPAVSGDLVCTKLRQTSYRVVASPEWVAHHGRPDAPSALSETDSVLFALPGYRDSWTFRDRSGHLETVPVTGKLLFSNGDCVVDAMLAGLGPALLTDFLVQSHLRTQRCIDLFADYDVTATSFDTAAWIVYPSRHYLPRKTRVVIDFFKERLR
ncbi:MAG: LysR family transcriptional regulator [Pseudomonadota bacterium]